MCIFGFIISLSAESLSFFMKLIGVCVQGVGVKGGGGLVVKVYCKESPSIRGHLKGWSPCSHSGQMLQDTLSAQIADA